MRAVVVMILLLVNSIIYSQIVNNSSLHYQISHSQRQKKDRKIFPENYVLHYQDSIIVPLLYKGDVIKKHVSFVTYQMEKTNDTIFATYNDGTEITRTPMFTLNTMNMITIDFEFDFPIMFFDRGVKTRYVRTQEINVMGIDRDVYRFKLENFPEDGYSIVFLDVKTLIPLQYEIYSFTQNNRLKFYTGLELVKIDNSASDYVGQRIHDFKKY